MSPTPPGPDPAPSMAGLTLRQRLAILLGVSAVVLLVAGVILFTSLSTLAQERSAVVDDIDPAALAARDLRTALVDQETGVRGFVITGDTDFLQPYNRGQSAELQAKAVLEPYAMRSEVIRASFENLRDAAARWQTEFAAPAVAGTIAGDDGESSDEVQARGRLLFEDVRAAINRLDGDLNAQRDTAIVQLDIAARRVWTVAVCVLIGLVALGIVVAVALNRSVTRPIVELASDVRGIAEGDLTRPISAEGTPEIVRLGADIDAMRLQILAEVERLNRANGAIERQALDLQRSNDDLEQFAYVASHDLQEPLRKIAGFCQLLERRYKGQLDDRADEYIEFVVDGAKRMQDLINDLLAFSRVGRTTTGFAEVDLDRIAAEAVDNLGSAVADARADIRLGDLPVVRGDRRLLVALFQNLIGNAVKFRGVDDPVVHVAAARDGDHWLLTVQDNGIGIDPEYADQIFTIFQRLHNKTEYEGTGIGLALAKKIVEYHGGEIGLVPGSGPGSTFRFSLPVSVAPLGGTEALVAPTTSGTTTTTDTRSPATPASSGPDHRSPIAQETTT